MQATPGNLKEESGASVALSGARGAAAVTREVVGLGLAGCVQGREGSGDGGNAVNEDGERAAEGTGGVPLSGWIPRRGQVARRRLRARSSLVPGSTSNDAEPAWRSGMVGHGDTQQTGLDVKKN